MNELTSVTNETEVDALLLVLDIVLEIDGPEKAYDLILLPVPALQSDAATVNLFFPLTSILWLFIIAGVNLIVPIVGLILPGTFTVNVLIPLD